MFESTKGISAYHARVEDKGHGLKKENCKSIVQSSIQETEQELYLNVPDCPMFCALSV